MSVAFSYRVADEYKVVFWSPEEEVYPGPFAIQG